MEDCGHEQRQFGLFRTRRAVKREERVKRARQRVEIECFHSGSDVPGGSKRSGCEDSQAFRADLVIGSEERGFQDAAVDGDFDVDAGKGGLVDDDAEFWRKSQQRRRHVRGVGFSNEVDCSGSGSWECRFEQLKGFSSSCEERLQDGTFDTRYVVIAPAEGTQSSM